MFRELSNPGASGSIFYLTKDDEFILKTVMSKVPHFIFFKRGSGTVLVYLADLDPSKNSIIRKSNRETNCQNSKGIFL